MEKGSVVRFPFDIQFISASTTVSVRRFSVGSRVASVSRALIVLRAFGKLSAFIKCGISESSFQPTLNLDAYPRFRPRSLYLRTIHMRDRQATKCCLQAFRKSPSHLLGPILFISRHRSEPVFRAKKVREIAFFPSPFNDLSRAQNDDPFSGLSSVGIRSTVYG